MKKTEAGRQNRDTDTETDEGKRDDKRWRAQTEGDEGYKNATSEGSAEKKKKKD